ncbi:ribosomal protein S21 [Rhizobium tibeticum]|uniref:Small ribosomal subunit protein bS21 n=1 Tax=Rhizobium tibeticum TaxID=501024 RepID=A0A1H8KFU0_9HYPH|nr:hypothetical protein RTCCBAU85039_2480 [Rhizobium tibeticum]SEN91812.1 ribosomal protein S21 [Rhizobium tibeticum]
MTKVTTNSRWPTYIANGGINKGKKQAIWVRADRATLIGGASGIPGYAEWQPFEGSTNRRREGQDTVFYGKNRESIWTSTRHSAIRNLNRKAPAARTVYFLPLAPCRRRDQPNQRNVILVQVLVRDNNVDQALRALKKKMQREGIFREMKMRDYYEKPSQKRAREKAEAVRRVRKLARKRAQREGIVAR